MIQNTELGLGTIIRITMDYPDSREAKEISDLAFAGMRRVERLMSVYRSDSEIGILNQKGFHDNLSAETEEVIEKALRFWAITDGAFDVKIGKGIDLGGIAKGYAVDVAIKILSENGVKSALVDAGGDIRVIGRRPDASPWRIGLGDPKSRRKITGIIGVADLAVATSGTYRRGIPDIIDARSGRTAKGVLRSTVVAKKTVDADALATSTYILGADEGIKLIEDIDGAAALILKSDGEVVESKRWRALTEFYECH